jgi:hypothetical protein
MAIIRKALVIVLIVFSVLYLFMPVFASEGPTLQEKADILNRLGILKGDGVDYRLDSPLTRAEAAVFIVRIMGREEQVLANKELYWATPFSDVISIRWYAPYVGFCAERDIIGGEPDGRFRPNDPISEKAFLKLVLGAMGYVYGEDFTWGEVYSKSFDVGLVRDDAYSGGTYSGGTDDGSAYTRGKMVDVIFSALTLNHNKTGVKLVLSLVNDGAVSRDTAESLGFIGKDNPTGIDRLEAYGGNSVLVVFDEMVRNISADNIAIYVRGNTGRKLEVLMCGQLRNELLVRTSRQTEGTRYTIEISNVADLEGNVTESVSGSFRGSAGNAEVSDAFRIYEVEAADRNTLNVYFTQPLNVNSENPGLYEIFENGSPFAAGGARSITVRRMASSGNGVVICLKNEMFSGDAGYVLKVGGELYSTYGVMLNGGEGDSMEFEGTDAGSGQLRLVDLVLENDRTIRMEFSKEIDPGIDAEISGCHVAEAGGDPIGVDRIVAGGEGSREGRLVYVVVSEAFRQDRVYSIKMESISDVTGRFVISSLSRTFTARVPESSGLTIKRVDALDDSTLQVYFSKPLDRSSAPAPDCFLIEPAGTSGKAFPAAKAIISGEDRPYAVKVFLPPESRLSEDKEYRLVVQGEIKDFLGFGPPGRLEAGFAGSGLKSAEPAAREAVILSGQALRIKLDREADIKMEEILSDFIIEYEDSGAILRKAPISAIFIDYTTLVLMFDHLDPDMDYILKYGPLRNFYRRSGESGKSGMKSIRVSAANR